MLKKAPIYLLSNILNAGIPFFLLPILTNELDPSEYGVVAMFAILLNIFGSICGLSLHGAIKVRYFESSTEELNDYISTSIFILLSTTTLLLITTALTKDIISSILNIPSKWIVIAVVVSFFMFLINLQLSLWQVTGKAWFYSSLQISRTLLDFSLSIALIIAAKLTWDGRLIGQSTAIVFFGFLSLFLIKKRLNTLVFRKKKNAKTKAYAKEALTYGIPLIPHVIGGLLITTTDRIIIANIINVDAVGIYFVAFQISLLLSILTDAFNKAYSPWLFQQLTKKNNTNNISIVRGTYAYIALLIILAIFIGIMVPLISPYFIGSEFLQASSLIIYMCIGFAFGGGYYMVVNLLFFHKKTKDLATTTFFVGILNIPVCYVLVHLYGLKGAAIAFMIAKFTSFISIWYLSNKIHPMPWLEAIKFSSKPKMGNKA